MENSGALSAQSFSAVQSDFLSREQLPTPNMWCADCKQEVPGATTPHTARRVACVRCGAKLTAAVTATATLKATAPYVPAEDWVLDEHLEAVHQCLQVLATPRFDPPKGGNCAGSSDWRDAAQSATDPSISRLRMTGIAWSGLAFLVGGAGLCLASVIGYSEAWWRVGLLALAVGQGALAIGLLWPIGLALAERKA
jgi:hypothetical protein